MTACPGCSHGRLVPIVFGMPSMETFEAVERNEAVLGGCLVSDLPISEPVCCLGCSWSGAVINGRFVGGPEFMDLADHLPFTEAYGPAFELIDRDDLVDIVVQICCGRDESEVSEWVSRSANHRSAWVALTLEVERLRELNRDDV